MTSGAIAVQLLLGADGVWRATVGGRPVAQVAEAEPSLALAKLGRAVAAAAWSARCDEADVLSGVAGVLYGAGDGR